MTFCRTLYGNHLTGDKWKSIVTLDKAWDYLNDRNKKGIFTIKNLDKKMTKPSFENGGEKEF